MKILWWFFQGCSPLPIPNREVKSLMADGTAPQCGRVGSCHIHSSPVGFPAGLFFAHYPSSTGGIWTSHWKTQMAGSIFVRPYRHGTTFFLFQDLICRSARRSSSYTHPPFAFDNYRVKRSSPSITTNRGNCKAHSCSMEIKFFF